MFKRLYAIGAHEDFFPLPRAVPDFRRGLVRRVPRRGTGSTTPWYREYHAVVFQPIAYCPLENLLAKYCSYIETR